MRSGAIGSAMIDRARVPTTFSHNRRRKVGKGSRNRELLLIPKTGLPDLFHDAINVGTVLGVDLPDQLLPPARSRQRDRERAAARLVPLEHAKPDFSRGVPVPVRQYVTQLS